MTAPVLSPVRWWRDDATRYVTRGPQLVPGPARDLGLQWAFDLIRGPIDRGMQRSLATYADLVASALLTPPVPAEMLDEGPGGMTGTSLAINEYRARLGLPPL